MVKIQPQIGIYILLLAGLIACREPAQPKQASGTDGTAGPATVEPVSADYERILYVSDKNGTDHSDGGDPGNPHKTVGFAVAQAEKIAAGKPVAVLIARGEYTIQRLTVPENVHLFGGYSEEEWQRDIFAFPTTLTGNDKDRLLNLSDNTAIDGFRITGGSIRGKGGAVYCDGTAPVITNNVFFGNRTLGPERWQPEFWHETAHDGGALYGTSGAAPVVEKNLFYHNQTENGRGGAVAFDGKCRPVLRKNVFIANEAGLRDPMRSSDGGAISIFDWCNADIDENIFLSNRALSNNDGGALFVALWSSARIRNNIFVDSEAGDDAGAVFIGGQEHRYDAPLDPIPPEDQFFVEIDGNLFIGNRNSSMNSGAMRFTMESRGLFAGNTTAQNNGIYFQRSEVTIRNNVILDDFLLIETKEGLGESLIEYNLIWADAIIDAPAVVRNNRMKIPSPDPSNIVRPPDFERNEMELTVLSAVFNHRTYMTTTYVGETHLAANSLIYRIVRNDDRWGIIRSNTAGTIEIWGNLSGLSRIMVLPTYTLRIKDKG